ncbi:MAG: hypothetical protein EBZ48_00660 [Proteobacteria bacterium]|nr:hypothetical protein [Pseudomonadota bacterium]
MLAHPSFLKLCEALHHASPGQDLEPGTKIARGFADLGYEEFLLLPGEKLLALYSGQVTLLQEEHRRFFFPVPTPDEMVERIIRDNWDILNLTYEEQRSWRLTICEATTKVTRTIVGSTIEESLVRGLLALRLSEAVT